MSGWALGTSVAMLTFYASALFLAVQHVKDRYSPLLIPVVFRQQRVWASLGSLAAAVVFSGTLLLLPTTLLLALAAFALLLFSIAGALMAAYLTLAMVADGVRLVPWIMQCPDQEAAIEDVLWNAFGRTDRRVVAGVLKAALTGPVTSQDQTLEWLIRHREMLATEWLAREVLAALLDVPYGSGDTMRRRDVMILMFREILAAEAFPLARDFVDATMGMLAAARPWTMEHGSLLHYTGFAIWNVGERGVYSALRTARSPIQLEDTKDLFIARTKAIWYHVQMLQDDKAVFAYARVLGDLAEDLQDKNAREWMLSRIFDVMADGFERHILMRDTIRELVSSLGFLRRRLDADDAENQEQIDSHVINLAAMYLELPPDPADQDPGGQAVTEDSDTVEVLEVPDDMQLGDQDSVTHLLANGGMFRRYRARKRFVCHQQDWVKPESYQEIARRLHVNHFE